VRVIVLGRSGQVARELARVLPDALFLGREQADFLTPDAAATALTERIAGADAVINAAAWTAVDKAETEEAAAHLVNAETPGALARVAAAHGVPFLHISTDYVFDGSGTAPWRPDDPTGPLGAYARTKLAGEQAVRAAGGRHVILRTSWVFSAHGANFVKTMLRLGAERPRLTVVADQIGGPTPAGAIAEALAAIARDPHTTGTFHFAGAPDTSWAGFARAIMAQAGLTAEIADIPTSAYPTPAQRPANSRLDCTTLADTYGIARPDWREGLAQVLHDLRAS
jgi:dTDP-4-dehydrorhamnose reductase